MEGKCVNKEGEKWPIQLLLDPWTKFNFGPEL